MDSPGRFVGQVTPISSIEVVQAEVRVEVRVRVIRVRRYFMLKLFWFKVGVK